MVTTGTAIGMGILLLVCMILMITTAAQIKKTNKEIKELYQDNFWDALIEDAPSMKYSDSYEVNIGITHIFSYGPYEVIVWPTGLASVHNGTDCVLCTFNEEKSRKLAQILLEKIK